MVCEAALTDAGSHAYANRVPGDAQLSSAVRALERITVRIAKVNWQRNFFDHRLRHDESENEKAAYIRENPVRAGLIGPNDEWRLCHQQ